MANFLTLDDLKATGKRVLVRLDLNLPFQKECVTDLTRLERSLPTLKELSRQGAKVIILAHRGRPKGVNTSLTLAPVFEILKKTIAPIPVFFCKEASGLGVTAAIQELKEGEVLLLENIRFVEGEKKNDPTFAQEMARWADIYVNDAFSAAHRAHASTEGIAHLLPAYAGRLMEEELTVLERVFDRPQRPLMAIVGGAKISTKLPLLENLFSKVDVFVIGGAMANTFLAAQGYNVGASLYEPNLLKVAQDFLAKGVQVLLPQDVIVAQNLEEPERSKTCLISEISNHDKIVDIGFLTIQVILEKMRTCHTLLWNGPLGVFEKPPFDNGTTVVAQGAAQLTREGSLFSIAGGGDTGAALANANVLEDFTYVSTAGGAFLETLEGKTLPGVMALEKNNIS